MKKHIFFELIACTVLLITGCVEKNSTDPNQAYNREGNGQEDAVNTIQVGSKYRITGPMDEYKDAVICMNLFLLNTSIQRPALT